MNAHEAGGATGPAQGGAAAAGAPSEDEMRAAYEAELSRITTTDMIAQATVSLLNLGARRLGPPPQPPSAADAPGAPDATGQDAAAAGRDLAQARDAIDAARALLAILERTIPAKELGPLRDALSQLQMAYAREIQTNPAEAPPAPAAGPAAPTQGTPAEPRAKPDGQSPAGAPGPAQASGRLWVPGS
ncbi:MAG TPA: hypothetical protein VFY36_00285 [Solirubrobacteraceae bacterium]|nr:hypothetical protein [Solirubrobacteraceae bacterium]